MSKLFGTDGVRGIANRELTCELAMKIGKAAATVLTSECKHKAKILIGKDTRISSDMLECALLAGLSSVGADATTLGVVPTPAVAYLVKKYNADAGIMISASHNSFEFNGIKLFDKNGFKLSDDIQEQMENIILSNDPVPTPIGKDIGKITFCHTAAQDYADYIKSIFQNINKNLKIAIDCANGSASSTAKKIFGNLSLKTHILFDCPTGININENCGSTSLENLAKYVSENNCDMGIAFDGDADRCLCIDENGDVIDGDAILAICANHMKSKGTLQNNTLVGTIMSNLGLKKFCKQNNIDFLETRVGDRYVLETMKQKDCNLGGEQSGHVIFSDYLATGDGQLTATVILNILSESNKKASELKNIIKKYPQKSATVNINFNQKGLLAKNKKIVEYIKTIQNSLGEYGRIVIRESGTEPKIRIMAEHQDVTKLREIICDAVKTISQNLK